MFFQRFPITYVLRAQEATCVLSTLFGDHIFPCGNLKKNSVASWRLPKKLNFGPWHKFKYTPVRHSEEPSSHSQICRTPYLNLLVVLSLKKITVEIMGKISTLPYKCTAVILMLFLKVPLTPKIVFALLQNVSDLEMFKTKIKKIHKILALLWTFKVAMFSFSTAL